MRSEDSQVSLKRKCIILEAGELFPYPANMDKIITSWLDRRLPLVMDRVTRYAEEFKVTIDAVEIAVREVDFTILQSEFSAIEKSIVELEQALHIRQSLKDLDSIIPDDVPDETFEEPLDDDRPF